MRRILAVVAAALGLLGSAGQATAAPGDSALELAAQAAAGAQAAGAQSGAAQSQPTNTNVSVRVLSPGDNGNVSQSNTVSSNATAGNANVTGQSANQAQSGSCGCTGGTQAVGQQADSSQAATALSYAQQSGASNTNIPVRVLSPGNNGNVSQTNSVESGATAANANGTGQSAEQAAAGGSGTQAVGQDADSKQQAAAASAAEQKGAENTNVSVRVLSPGNDGNVTQSNTVASKATAANINLTGQSAGQAGGSGGTQAIGQDADNDQSATALSAAKQDGATNRNIPVRVSSPGNDGNVTQANTVSSSAGAGNLNATKQAAQQGQGGRDTCCAGGGTQAIGQSAKSDQSAGAASLAVQSGGHDRCKCDSSGNTNAPVRIDSKGDGGSVEQANDVSSAAAAGNLNLTWQLAGQGQGGSGGTQAIGQKAKNEQDALAVSAALQSGARNENTPVRVDSKGDDGDVTQTNSVDSQATALNGNLTKQAADQTQGGSSCGCHSKGIQATGQESYNKQGAGALSLALQQGATNENTPVAVGSYGGGGGSVEQSNSVGSAATAANLNALGQSAEQTQGGGHGIAIQAIGQSAKSDQKAIGLSAALQQGASNRNAPVAVGGKDDRKAYGRKDDHKRHGGKADYKADHKDGHKAAPKAGGKVSQSNSVASRASALNANLTKQDAGQNQGGHSSACGCHGAIGIQATGQEAKNEQDALAGSLALQGFGREKCGCPSGGNSSTPVGIGSHGSGGSVEQSNAAHSSALAPNLNALFQNAGQVQSGGGGTQAVGQSAKNHQAAIGLSAALQLTPFNSIGRSHAI